MKTENNETRMDEINQKVELLLTPRFAPSAEGFQLQTKPRKLKRTLLINLARIGGVAAALIVGIFALVGPTNKVEAKEPMEVISEALKEFNKADSYRVTFTAKVKQARKNANDYYRIASDGKEIKGVLTILKTNSQNGGIMRIEWESGVTQLYDGERYYEWEGTTPTKDMQCHFQTLKVLHLADLEFVISEFRKDGLKINKENDGDKIQVIKDSPDYAMVGERMEGIFSQKSGKLIGGGYYEKKDNEWIPIIKLHNIEYGFPYTIEQITASPKR